MNYKTTKKSVNLAKKSLIFIVIFGVLSGVFYPLTEVKAVETLAISNVTVTPGDTKATIVWHTNRPTTGTIQYGLSADNYNWSISTNVSMADQAITIFGLNPETTYYFRITVTDGLAEAASFGQSFKTSTQVYNTTPTISDVRVAATTGTTATVQWLTDRPATSEVTYYIDGQAQNTFTAQDGNLVKIHDLTLSNLTIGALYRFRVKAKDKDNNTAVWYEMSFRLDYTDLSDRAALTIANIQPTGENNSNVTQTSAIITWQTDKLSDGQVRYGLDANYGTTVNDNPPRAFMHSATLIGLKPGTTYYYTIYSKDVTGRQAQTTGLSFTTKPVLGTVTDDQPTYHPAVLGVANCNVNLKTDLGFYGLYYNLPNNHPDMEIDASTWAKVGRQNDWYDQKYFAFSRVDQNLKFGNNFFPVNTGLPGDPQDFAVNWRAIIEVPQTDTYSLSMTTDDDGWLLIDDQVILNTSGIHDAKTAAQQIQLTAGNHKFEIFYADRHKVGAVMTFEPASRLIFHPLPLDCTINDILNFSQPPDSNNGNQNNNSGQVLGASTDETADKGVYLNGWDGVYTKFITLYRTSASPDIWAITDTNQRFYITSPVSFNKYGLNWSKVKIVSDKALNKYPVANLVKLPNNPAIYMLQQRTEKKWLKLLIPTGTVFVSYPKNHWGNVIKINNLDLTQYPTAILIKVAGNAKVYQLAGNSKQPFANEVAFKNKNYNWADVVTVTQTHAESYLDGAAIQ